MILFGRFAIDGKQFGFGIVHLDNVVIKVLTGNVIHVSYARQCLVFHLLVF